MSNHYWNEFIKYYIDDRMLLNTLKYHQKAVDKFCYPPQIDQTLIELCRADTVRVADVKLDTFTTSNKNIQKLFLYLNKLYSSVETKVSFPVIIFMNNKSIEKPGVYSYDFSTQKFHMIGTLTERILELVNVNSQCDVIVCFFLNIVQALALYGKKGYIKGIEEIGYISLNLITKYQDINRFYVPEQEFTHLIGVNPRHILLIETLIM